MESVITLQFWLAFPWCLITLSMPLHAFRLFIHLLWRTVYSDHLPILNLITWLHQVLLVTLRIFVVSHGISRCIFCCGTQALTVARGLSSRSIWAKLLCSTWDLSFRTKDELRHPLQWKQRVLTSGPPENSLFSHFLNEIKKKNTTFYFILEYTWLVSGGQKRDSLIDIQIFILPEIPLPSRLPQNIEHCSLCYTVGPCWFSILNKAVCACWWQTPYLTLPCLFSHFCYCPLKYWHFWFL